MEKGRKAYIDLDVWKEARSSANELYVAQKYLNELILKSILLKLETTRNLLNGFIKYYQQLVK